MIEFIDVTKTYPTADRPSLQDVSLKIDEGEFVFVVGASGAGKSTLIKLLTCEEMPTSGKIILNGVNISTLTHNQIPYLRRQIGVVFQDYRLIPNMNVFENVAFAMRVVGKSRREIKKRVPKMLEMVELSDKAKSMPDQLSGGEKQRVAFARALINSPKMIIADEPTGNLDPNMSIELMSLLAGISQKGNITCLVVTHEKSLVDRLNKRVISISEGKIISDMQGGYR